MRMDRERRFRKSLSHNTIRENHELVPALLFHGREVRRDNRDDLLNTSVEIPLYDDAQMDRPTLPVLRVGL